MAPQDDLTAERAEDLYSSIKASSDGFNDDQATDDLCVEMLRQALKTARQEALREVVALHQEWLDGKHSGTFSDVLLDRLTREGVTG